MVFIPRWEKYKDKKPSGLVEVNYANELAKGLKVAMMPEAGMQNLAIETLTTATNPLVTNEDQQKNWIFDRSTDTTIDTKYSNSSIAEHSCFLITRHRLLLSVKLETYVTNRVSANNGFAFYTESASGSFPNQTFRCGYVHGGVAAYTSSYTITGSNTNFIPIGFAAKINSAVDFYVNGKNVDSVAIGSINNNSDTFRIGKDGFFNSALLHNEMPVLYHFDRQLSEEEFATLSENPYQILKPRQSFFVFGAAAGTQTLTPSVVTNTNTFETATVTPQNTLTASVVTNDHIFHDITLTTSNSVVVDLYANSASFHNVNVTPSNSLQASLVTNSQSFFSADVTPSTSLQASLVTNTQTFYSPVVSLEGAQIVAPNLLTNTQSFYSATISTGAVSVTVPLVTNGQTFYAANVSQGAVVLQPELAVNGSTFYSSTVTAGAAALQPSLLTGSNSFYTAVVSLEGAKTLAPSIVTNSSTFHSATVTTGQVTITTDHWSNTSSFYATTITPVNALQPALVTSAPSFYTHVVTAGAPTLQPSLLTNSSVFYTANVTLGAGTQTLQPSLVVNNNVFYNGQVVFDQTLTSGLFVNQPTFYGASVFDAAMYRETINLSTSIKQASFHEMKMKRILDFSIGL